MTKATGKLITRAEVAKALGKDKSFVIREEKAGRLKPVATGKRGARLYDEQEIRALIGGGPIERLPKALPYAPRAGTSMAGVSAQTAAKAIARLAAGATRLDVLVEFELYAEQVEELDAARVRLQGGLSLTKEHLDQLKLLLGLRPKADDPAAFVRLIERLVANLTCARCGEGRASDCEGCVSRYVHEAVAIMEARHVNASRAAARQQSDSRVRAAPSDVQSRRQSWGHGRASDGASSPSVSVPTAAHSLSDVGGEPPATAGDRKDAGPRGAGPAEPPASLENGPGQPLRPHGGADKNATRVSPSAGDAVVWQSVLNPNDPAFLDQYMLELKREQAILKRLLANSPLTEADRIMLEGERRER